MNSNTELLYLTRPLYISPTSCISSIILQISLLVEFLHFCLLKKIKIKHFLMYSKVIVSIFKYCFIRGFTILNIQTRLKRTFFQKIMIFIACLTYKVQKCNVKINLNVNSALVDNKWEYKRAWAGLGEHSKRCNVVLICSTATQLFITLCCGL